MDQPKSKYRADAMMNEDFISLKTCSGCFNFLVDPEAPEHLLSPNAMEEEIGRAVLDTLSRSRILNPKENRDFFNFEKAVERYERWVQQIIVKYEYKSRRFMFLNMKSCAIDAREDIIIIKPSSHFKLEEWRRNKSDGLEDVIISAGSSPIEIGGALKEAFKRCV